jgi:hypothetical protein
MGAAGARPTSVQRSAGGSGRGGDGGRKGKCTSPRAGPRGGTIGYTRVLKGYTGGGRKGKRTSSRAGPGASRTRCRAPAAAAGGSPSSRFPLRAVPLGPFPTKAVSHLGRFRLRPFHTLSNARSSGRVSLGPHPAAWTASPVAQCPTYTPVGSAGLFTSRSSSSNS